MSGTVVTAIVLAVIAIANICVSVAVFRSDYYGAGQKSLQALLIWLLPVLGAAAVGVFLYSQRDSPKFDTRAYPERSEKAKLLTYIDHTGR
jgi:hypothetical protein